MKAIWKDQVIAESEDTVVVEGNHYFPPDSIDRSFFESSDTTTICPWKGTASYYHVSVGGEKNSDAAWTYPTPKPAAEEIRDRIAFWRGVVVEG
jgi:uncharacterized protein (DUF427 family)